MCIPFYLAISALKDHEKTQKTFHFLWYGGLIQYFIGYRRRSTLGYFVNGLDGYGT